MAYGNKQFAGKKKGTAVRLTGLFRSRDNKKLCTGSIQADNLGELIALIKKAKAEDKGIVFFMWKNDDIESPKDPIFTLKADVSKPFEKKKKIEADDDFDSEEGEEPEGDSLFD